MTGYIVNLGVFVADTAYRADRMPRMGETILGNGFGLGPGGKGSNQSVASARLGADIRFLSKTGDDTFADMAFSIWEESGVTPVVERSPEGYTGAAFIFVDDASGDNAIIISPGVASTISAEFVERNAALIEGAAIFMTQLEQPMDAAVRALEIARAAGVTTILNPAPAAELPEGMLALCDYVTPNETEAEALTGLPVTTLEEARAAGDALLDLGVGTAIVTLGERGALFHNRDTSMLVPAVSAGPVVETTGAGDAFNGGFAAALSLGVEPVEAARTGCATAGISVTRAGTAPSMPLRGEVDDLLASVSKDT